MGEASSVAELTIEDIQNQLNESEKLQLTSNTQPPRFLVGLRSTEANINETFVFMIKGRYINVKGLKYAFECRFPFENKYEACKKCQRIIILKIMLNFSIYFFTNLFTFCGLYKNNYFKNIFNIFKKTTRLGNI